MFRDSNLPDCQQITTLAPAFSGRICCQITSEGRLTPCAAQSPGRPRIIRTIAQVYQVCHPIEPIDRRILDDVMRLKWFDSDSTNGSATSADLCGFNYCTCDRLLQRSGASVLTVFSVPTVWRMPTSATVAGSDDRAIAATVAGPCIVRCTRRMCPEHTNLWWNGLLYRRMLLCSRWNMRLRTGTMWCSAILRGFVWRRPLRLWSTGSCSASVSGQL